MSSPSPVRDQRRALRAARLRRNWTLSAVVRALEAASGHAAGATESLVSAWELGKVTPGLHYRGLLCQIYEASPEELGLIAGAPAAAGHVGLVTSYEALVAEMIAVVSEADETLVTTGSRSREQRYLEAIERRLREQPELVYYRVLLGPLRSLELRDHLLSVLTLRDPRELPRGVRTLHIRFVEDLDREPERYICASERAAVVAMPSFVTPGNFDSGVVLSTATAAAGLVSHVKQLALSAPRIETSAAVHRLPLVL